MHTALTLSLSQLKQCSSKPYVWERILRENLLILCVHSLNFYVFSPPVPGKIFSLPRAITSARGKKQVWRPHVRTQDLSEANVLYWRKNCGIFVTFRRTCSDSAPGESCPFAPLVTPLVAGFDIGGQHGRQFVLLRHTHKPQRKGGHTHLCKHERKRPTPVRRRLSRTHAVFGRVIPWGWVPVSGLKKRSVVALSNHYAFHRWSAESAARMLLLLSDKLMSCCAAGTNGCLDFRLSRAGV